MAPKPKRRALSFVQVLLTLITGLLGTGESEGEVRDPLDHVLRRNGETCRSSATVGFAVLGALVNIIQIFFP